MSDCLSTMTPTEYRTLRKTIGRQWDLAVLLNCNVRTIERRESGKAPITEQDAADIRRLVAGPKPEPTELPRPLHADTIPRQQTGDPLRDNIEHWYVEPGYVLS